MSSPSIAPCPSAKSVLPFTWPLFWKGENQGKTQYLDEGVSLT